MFEPADGEPVPVDESEPVDEPVPLAELEDGAAVVVLKVEPFA
jgi:hypothetical protein